MEEPRLGVMLDYVIDPATLPEPGAWGVCPHCHERLPYVLPHEPLYDIDVAAALIPMTPVALYGYLYRYKHDFPRRYRRTGSGGHLRRMLLASELRVLRRAMLLFRPVNLKDREGGRTWKERAIERKVREYDAEEEAL